jgi:hypothetical protein
LSAKKGTVTLERFAVALHTNSQRKQGPLACAGGWYAPRQRELLKNENLPTHFPSPQTCAEQVVPARQNVLLERFALRFALTGSEQDGDKERSWEAGCERRLVKAVNLADLEQLLAATAELQWPRPEESRGGSARPAPYSARDHSPLNSETSILYSAVCSYGASLAKAAVPALT